MTKKEQEEYEKREWYIRILNKNGMLQDLKDRCCENDIDNIPFARIESYVRRLVRGNPVKIKNKITGRFICDRSGNIKIFDCIRDATSFMEKYGYGLNKNEFRFVSLSQSSKQKEYEASGFSQRFIHKSLDETKPCESLPLLQSDKEKNLREQISYYLKNGLSPRNLRLAIEHSDCTNEEKERVMKELHIDELCMNS